jgi:hypothetical protein
MMITLCIRYTINSTLTLGLFKVAYVEDTTWNSTGILYLDSVQIDSHLKSYYLHRAVTFSINGKPSIDCIAQDPNCYDIAITGRLVNVTSKAELQMVYEMIFLDSFFDEVSSYDDVDADFYFESVYKMDIEQITISYTVTNQSSLVDVNDYYRVNNDDLLNFYKGGDEEFDDLLNSYKGGDDDITEYNW